MFTASRLNKGSWILYLTDHQAKYIAYELTRRFPPDSAERIAAALVDAQVDLNPHQIDAALFAFKSPLSKGALLADEVGLGKTIEAGLVLSQKWAERKRRILVVTLSNLRKQWYQELTEKFFLPCRLLESKSYNAAIRQGHFRPFEAPDIVICSYQFARNKASDVHAIPWDLAAVTDVGQVLDEETAIRLLSLPGEVKGKANEPLRIEILDELTQQRQVAIRKEISERNARFFYAEAEKLDGWADDLKLGLEREIKELDRQIKEARRTASAAMTLEEKLAAQKQIRSLESQRNQKRRSLFDAQDEVDRQREELIARIEGKLQQRVVGKSLFFLRWRLTSGVSWN